MPVFEVGFIGFYIGGDDRSRTDDILLAKQTLYQLSYVPMFNETLGLFLCSHLFDETRAWWA